MKTPLQGSIALGPLQPEVLVKVRQEPTRYHILTPNSPIKQHGRSYGFVVLKFDIMPDGTARQNGQAVLCDTQQEACSTTAQLSQIRKKHLGAIQAAGLGAVAWVTNLRRLVREILVRKAKPPRRRRLWLALERDIDQDTNEVTPLRNTSQTPPGSAQGRRQAATCTPAGSQSRASSVPHPPACVPQALHKASQPRVAPSPSRRDAKSPPLPSHLLPQPFLTIHPYWFTFTRTIPSPQRSAQARTQPRFLPTSLRIIKHFQPQPAIGPQETGQNRRLLPADTLGDA